MNDLRPCPFCGGQVKLKADDSGGYSIECCNHEWPKERFTQQIPDKTIAADVLMCSWGQGEEAKQALIEAWNTRAERTCKNKAPRYLDFLCSECGFVHYIDDSNCTGDGNEWNYCPNCGWVVEQ